MLSGLFTIGLLAPGLAFADVYVPLHEYLGYFDANGVYTVVGNVKNEGDFGAIPTVTVSVIEDSQTVSRTIEHVPLAAGSEIPFKIKFPEIRSGTPVLANPELTYEQADAPPVPIRILYDKTLVKHEDGHISGRIQNTGNETVHFPKIFAVVHGYERVLDITQSIEYIEKIEPGEILNFTMYPDPSITEDVFYYSCFAPVDTTVIPITVEKNGGDFDFRYDSGAWYSAAKFDESGTSMTIRGYNSYPLETYANFEFAPISGDEKFSVTFNDEPVEFIQSMDEMGYQHVAFSVEPRSQGILKISGFEKGLPPELPAIPIWIRQNADWWATQQISDSEFLEGIDFLFEKQILSVPSRQPASEPQWSVPQWVQAPASWWYEERITDEEFLELIRNLVQREIIVV